MICIYWTKTKVGIGHEFLRELAVISKKERKKKGKGKEKRGRKNRLSIFRNCDSPILFSILLLGNENRRS
jgi:hypothetical protein